MKAVYNRKRYIFNRANDFIAEVPAELAKELLVTGQYLPAAKSTSKENTSIEFNGGGDVVDLNNDFTCGFAGLKLKVSKVLLFTRLNIQGGEEMSRDNTLS